MNDLMIHVERIVRPLRAGERLKLRMRRELLAHLQAAVDEEQTIGHDSAAAIERAEQRLGDPVQLRRQLQQSVPRLHRIFLANIPMPGSLQQRPDVPTQNKSRLFPDISILDLGPIIHALLILVPAAVFPILLSVIIAAPLLSHLPASIAAPFSHPKILIGFAALLICLCPILCAQFSLAVARLGSQFHLLAAAGSAFAVVLINQCWILLISEALRGRSPYIHEFAQTLIASLLLLLVIALSSHWASKLRRPYAQWTMLEIEE